VAKVNVANDSGAWSRSAQIRPVLYCSAFALIFVLLSASLSPAQDSRPTESQVEAAYLYNFGKFITFPPNRAANSDPFSICIIGTDPFGESLDATVRGESINGKKITVQRLMKMQHAETCSILFVSSSEESHLPAIVAPAKTLGLLTVSDMKGFAERGGIIQLVRQQDRIRFEVNLAAAQESHLTLSSELLKVAVRVLQKGTQ
jgi:hypothetical protein